MAGIDGHESSSKTTVRLGVIGCGSMGTAILQGLLNAKASQIQLEYVHATVNSSASAEKLRKTLSAGSSVTHINVTVGQNVEAAAESEVIILACPPDLMKTVLTEAGMKDALRSKIMISVLAGVTSSDLNQTVNSTEDPMDDQRCYIYRALPNLAVAMNASATAIEINTVTPSSARTETVNAIFQTLGGIVHAPSSLMNAATVMCGSTPAFIALFMDGLLDGAVAAGVPRVTADVMVAQVLASTAALLKDGTRASMLRESVCAMPGCTIQGNLALEEGNVRGAASKSMKISIEAASRLG